MSSSHRNADEDLVQGINDGRLPVLLGDLALQGSWRWLARMRHGTQIENRSSHTLFAGALVERPRLDGGSGEGDRRVRRTVCLRAGLSPWPSSPAG